MGAGAYSYIYEDCSYYPSYFNKDVMSPPPVAYENVREC